MTILSTVNVANMKIATKSTLFLIIILQTTFKMYTRHREKEILSILCLIRQGNSTVLVMHLKWDLPTWTEAAIPCVL